MKKIKNSGKIIGLLFITLMLVYMAGSFLIDPILNAPNYLLQAAEKKNDLFLGVVLEFLNAVAYLGIAVLVYPIIKKISEPMALAYLAFRIIEFTMQVISDMSPLLLVTASQEFAVLQIYETSTAQAIGTVLLAQRFWANQMVFVTYALGAIIFYYSSYHLKLFPRFLSIWGLIGAPLVLVSVVCDSLAIDLGIELGLIMGLNEIILGIWLIVTGFYPGGSLNESTSQ